MPHRHRCAGCGTPVPRKHLACRACWDRLPEHYRTALRTAHHAPRAHARAAYQAHLWYLDHPPRYAEETP